MPTKEEKFKNRLWITGSIIGLLSTFTIFAVGLSQTENKAQKAYAYVEKNHALPEKVQRLEKQLEKQMESVEKIVLKFAVSYDRQERITKDMERLQIKLEHIVAASVGASP